MAAERPAVLVLCTGNSCRSQMAEAFLRQYAGDRYDVHSAGTEPAPAVHPLSVVVMQEAGIDLSGHHPKHLDTFHGQVAIHTVITVCDGAAENCPVWPGAPQRLHWPFRDPARFEGSEDETLAFFRVVRDEIEARVKDWIG